MNSFEELKRELEARREEGDFPDWLAAEIEQVFSRPESLAGAAEEIRRLAEQVRGYDPYAGAGCFSESFGPEDIRRTLGRLLKSPD